ncbi:MAG TPA: tetratricopeptide repeat protein [Methylomirabilota bacterium]|nr:tetratricopeptide repeat protein [Methylomirabilota bacterium]
MIRRWPAPSRRTLVITGGVVAVVVLLAAGGWLWYGVQERRAATAYAEATMRVVAAAGPGASAEAKTAAATALEDAVTRYPSASGGAKAALDLGNLRYESRQWAAARGAYEIAARRGRSGTVTILARSGIGHTWEAERDHAKAADAYQALARDLGPKDFLYEETLLDLARVQEQAGRKADAAETYRRVLKDVPNSRRAAEIRARLATLSISAR